MSVSPETQKRMVSERELTSILDDCENDFHVCERCGEQDNDATKTSNLYLILRNRLEALAALAPLPAEGLSEEEREQVEYARQKEKEISNAIVPLVHVANVTRLLAIIDRIAPQSSFGAQRSPMKKGE